MKTMQGSYQNLKLLLIQLLSIYLIIYKFSLSLSLQTRQQPDSKSQTVLQRTRKRPRWFAAFEHGAEPIDRPNAAKKVQSVQRGQQCVEQRK